MPSIPCRSLLLLAGLALMLGCGDDDPPNKPVGTPPPPTGLQSGVGIGTLPLTGNISVLAAGDLNGDSLPDVVAAGTYNEVWVGFGSATGITGGSVLDARVFAREVVIADLDRDGVGDLVAGGKGAITILRGSLGGLPAAAETLVALPDTVFVGSLRAGDLNHDGYDEVVATTYWSPPSGPAPRVYAARRITNSGSVDLGPIAGPAELGDVNADGSLDLVILIDQVTHSGIQVRLGAGNGTFGAESPIRESSTLASGLTLADLDGNGTEEAVLLSSEITIMAWSGGMMGPEFSVPGRPGGTAGVTADLNGDSHADLASGTAFHTDVSLLLGNGGGTFVVGTPVSAGDGVVEIVAGDFDGNGRVDLITRGLDTGTLRYMKNDNVAEPLAARR